MNGCKGYFDDTLKINKERPAIFPVPIHKIICDQFFA